MNEETPSLFTRIIQGEIPAHTVYEDERVIAFLDIHPLNPGHMLLVPKHQVEQLWDLPDEAYAYIWSVAKRLAGKLQEVLDPPRVGVIVEGFNVPHAHIHVLPLYTGDDLRKEQRFSEEPDHEALANMARSLQQS